MSRKIGAVALSLFFGFAVLVASVLRTSAKEAFGTSGLDRISPTPSRLSSGDDTVDYVLAYPGMLPDNLFYPLKMIRDRITLFFTTENSKKASLLLLFADKRLASAQALVGEGKVELAIETATKGEKYLEEAVETEKMAVSEGNKDAIFLDKLGTACLKHEETLLGMGNSLSDPAKGLIGKLVDYPKNCYLRIAEIKKGL